VARNNDRDRGAKRGAKEAPRRGGRKKVCIFCKDGISFVDYKDVNLLRKFLSDRGKIRARRVSGNCAQHQREVAVAIKTSRELALLPYTQRTMSERGPGQRGGRGDRGDRGDRGPRPPRGEEAEATLDSVITDDPVVAVDVPDVPDGAVDENVEVVATGGEDE
jgi:small subunit ribosomal protein S18